MTRSVIRPFACLVFAASVVAGCHSKKPVPENSIGAGNLIVSGTVTYRQRIALAPGSVVRVTVADVSKADAKASTVAEQVITTTGQQVPIAFDVAVPTRSIDERNTYAVSVRIESGGVLQFISTKRYPVMTKGNPWHHEIVVEPPPSPK